jgi:hypothetical protein
LCQQQQEIKIAMNKQLLTLAMLALALITGSGAIAQQQAVVRGTVQDQKGNGIAAVSIALLNAKDSALVKAAVSGDNGQYEIAANGSGNFLLSSIRLLVLKPIIQNLSIFRPVRLLKHPPPACKIKAGNWQVLPLPLPNHWCR